MKSLNILILLLLSAAAFSQSNSLNGDVINEKGVPMTSATVVLLNPVDSTMQYFGITNTMGEFEVRNIRPGNYLLQVAFIGYEVIYNNVTIPYRNNGNLGTIPMVPKPVNLDEVSIAGERIPLRINQDTIEYDAKAFKTAPGDVVEDMLKKMPGLEVDRAGNIKALGEDVTQVLVDGKEFFSNDPKVATKNLPADAIDKVQLFNKISEEAEFTGIEDGERNQTINLQLNKENKDGMFGEVMAGGGTDEHYQANAKVYRFSEKSQIAALGMLNNVNKYGFSIRDYLSFTGGISKISRGEGGSGMGSSGFPINFGETISGYASSGAVGLNYSYSRSEKQRYFISYIGNGSKRELVETSKTTNYRELDSYFQQDETEQVQRDTSHSINFGVRNLFNENNYIVLNGGLSYNTGFIPLSSDVSSYLNDVLLNSQTRESSDFSDRLSGNVSGSYIRSINEGKSYLKLSGNGSYSGSNTETVFENQTQYYSPDTTELINQFQDNKNKSYSYGGTLSFTQKLTKSYYLDFIVNASNSEETLKREQGDIASGDVLIDSLSPEFIKNNYSVRPGITLRRNTERSYISFGISYRMGTYGTSLWDDATVSESYRFFQPQFNWKYEYKTGRRITIRYSSRVNTPSANQLLPVVNNFNSLSLFYGNRDLKPEFIHSVFAHWWIFDQFSFTTVFAGLNLTYTKDKINFSRTVNDRLGQEVNLVNVDNDLTMGGNVDFSTPIRPLGIKTNLSIQEQYNKGINIVNGNENEVTNFTHRFSLTFDNRKKEKWDIVTGAGLTITDASYSIQESLNNIYYDISWFGEIRFTPNDKLSFNIAADITNYTAESFEESQVVPLVGAELSYRFMKYNRAALTLAGYDLLNRNTGIRRVSEMNYLQERQSNIIGRYIMLSFSYRLNKFESESSNMKFDMRRHR